MNGLPWDTSPLSEPPFSLSLQHPKVLALFNLYALWSRFNTAFKNLLAYHRWPSLSHTCSFSFSSLCVLSFSHSHSLTQTHTHTHTHTHYLSISLFLFFSLTYTHTLSLILSHTISLSDHSFIRGTHLRLFRVLDIL